MSLARPGPSANPPAPLIPSSGIAPLDSLANVINDTAAPWQQPPNPEDGTLVAVSHYVGATLGIVGGVFTLADTGLALATAKIASFFPALPAATLGALHVAPPHTHAHPPSWIPPAPPVPLPSIGAVMLAGCVSVLINGVPAARCGDYGLAPTCGGLFPILEVKTGSSQVFIGGARAARVLDLTEVCTPSSPPNAFARAMMGLGVAGVAAGGLAAAAAASQGQAMRAAMMAAQAAADGAALAMGLLAGKDPAAVPPPYPPPKGVVLPLPGTVMIGGFPMPDTLTALMGMMKGFRLLARGLRGGRRSGRLFCLRC
ncbi:MAG: PAAR domain-containing protein [Deltaproteobacteria bacterium]|nr:PAAR domain-containing protein [Deltaproteobacteria bacterium]